MVLQSEDEEKEATPRAPFVEEPARVALAAQLISSTMEEKENPIVFAEELDRYFFSPLADLASSSISKHLETMHEHLNRTFLMDLMVSAQPQKSLLRISKLTDALVASKVKEACQQLVVRLGTLAFNYKILEECRSSGFKSLN